MFGVILNGISVVVYIVAKTLMFQTVWSVDLFARDEYNMFLLGMSVQVGSARFGNRVMGKCNPSLRRTYFKLQYKQYASINEWSI